MNNTAMHHDPQRRSNHVEIRRQSGSGNRGIQGHRGGDRQGFAAAADASIAVNYASERSSAEAVVAAITASGGER